MYTFLFSKRSPIILAICATVLFAWRTSTAGNHSTRLLYFDGVASSVITKAPVQIEINSTYYLVRPDIRSCASPMCGGYFVRRVNRTTTKCFDDSEASTCYVAEINWGKNPIVNITNEGSVILRGSIERKTFSNGMTLGSFHATEVWQSPTKPTELSSKFYRTTKLSLACLVPPCQTYYHLGTLNSSLTSDIKTADFSGATTDKTILSQLTEAMKSPDGILVIGNLDGSTFDAKNFYFRVKS